MHQPDASSTIPWVIELRSSHWAQPMRVSICNSVIVGRGMDGAVPQPDVDLELWDSSNSVSCHHVLLYREDDALMVMDLNSDHGTALNGQRLETSVGYRITNGDQLTIGTLQTDVRILLAPVAMNASQEQPEINMRDMSTPAQNQWVLIVEHDAAIAQILAQLIEDVGYSVKTVRDEVSAMRVFSQKQPNAIILDLHLPDMDGLEFCRYVRRDVLHGTIPILVVNTGELPYLSNDVTQAGADVMLESPLNAVSLRDMTIALINQHENSAHAVRTRRLPNPTPFTVLPPDTRHHGLVVYVVGQENEPIVLKASEQKSVSFGRKPGGETLGSETHVDLTRYDAINCGVSRVHMFLHCLDNQFYIEDVDSRNGTFLNGSAIPSFQMKPLQNGDEIRLGHLRMYVYLIEDSVAVA
ncbi:MAG: FHA domain-containing protein [Chloroflexota bacterium]